jgi:hypothetical protein
MTVNTGFKNLLSEIAASDSDREIFLRHRASVTKRLTQTFRAHSVMPIGSYVRGTTLHRTSDLDLMLILRTNEARWGDYWRSSTRVLNKVRLQLQGRFTATPIVRDGQAVVVHFGDRQHPVDEVPAFFRGLVNKHPVYMIPDGEGNWMATSPPAHNSYLKRAIKRSGGKLKNVIKLIKYWRTRRQSPVPLNSFHLEMLLAENDVCVGAKTYAQCVYDAFALLAARKCRAMQDPLGISGLIEAADSESKRAVCQKATATAADRTTRALDAEERGRIKEAARLWSLVFKTRSPKFLRSID